MKSSTCYFHANTKTLTDFQICISVTLTKIVLFEEVRISEDSEFSILAVAVKSKTRKTRNFVKIVNCFVGGSWKFLRFPSFSFLLKN